ncbi:J domain-containing protein [Marinobacter apostichopi]|uniref:J domain-containing protein n=1 Tax=Marinobacter apostichopi TaxID=3035454 RepID=UPI0025734F5F|nr:J domain-containing protein [Marinobacter sp. LA51]
MNCWEVLGIEPTEDHQRIQLAYEQQLKFASGEEAEKLDRAFREATGGAPKPEAPQAPVVDQAPESDRALDANEGQIVREVVIQINALLNDSGRSRDVGIWKAILCEPPADQAPVRREIARKLEPQVRPMAENGSLPAPVAQFLGDWFEWASLQDIAVQAEEPQAGSAETDAEEADQPPQLVNFWPAVIGWIVGLAILASLFGGMGGGG